MAESTIGISTMKSGKIIFADTGALLAAANAKDKDKDHKRAKDFLTKLVEEKVILLVTNFIIAKIYTLMLRKIGRAESIEYVEKQRNTAEMGRVSEEDENKAWQIILRHQDNDFSYVDATSFVVMERLGIIAASDGHFEQYSLNRLPV